MVCMPHLIQVNYKCGVSRVEDRAYYGHLSLMAEDVNEK